LLSVFADFHSLLGKRYVDNEFSSIPLGLLQGDVNYGVTSLDQDPIGIKDLEMRSNLADQVTPIQFKFINNRVCIDPKWAIPTNQFLDKIFQIYEDKIKKIEKPEERLLAALWIVRELEVNHVFSDGNGRTSIAAFLGFLWNDQELPMALFYDPNILDGNGPEKLC
jgi:Fic/DOC family